MPLMAGRLAQTTPAAPSSIRATTSGGATWKAQSSHTHVTLYGVAFTDARDGWTVGANPPAG